MEKEKIKKLKIGLFIDTFYPMIDGVVIVVDNYAKRLAKIADVTVFAPKGRKPFDDGNLPYKVVRCKTKLPLFFLDYDLPLPTMDNAFKKELAKSNLDFVHLHSPFSIGKMGLKYAKKHKIPLLGTMHSQFKQDFLKQSHSKIIATALLKNVMNVFNACDECWTVGEKIADIYEEYGAKKRPLVQNNCTDMKLLKDTEKVKRLRKKYNIKKDEKVFLFVGRIDKIKNLYFTVDALKILKERGLKFKMIFVGSGMDEKDMRIKVKTSGLDDCVVFVGLIYDRKELALHYSLSDLFLFPSLYDSNSLVQLEAASQKTPTIFIEDAVTTGRITGDVNGYLSKNDPRTYAEKILDIFSDEKLYKQVCENAYRDLYLSWDDAVEKAYNNYLNLIERKKKEQA